MLSYHQFHLVTLSPWPIACGISSICTTVGLIFMFKVHTPYYFYYGLLCLLLCSSLWWRDVGREAVMLGDHSSKVQDGLKIGMLMFILSEALFFMAFFWAFFHNSVSPTLDIGLVWPPLATHPLDPFSVPLLNTCILLSSGASVTLAHHNIQFNKSVLVSLGLTILLGIIFTGFQLFEYKTCVFTISDSVFGATFFVATGFHGLHVIIGTLFLTWCLVRTLNKELVYSHHLGFEFAIWYWHFVDVVWLFLFSFIYWWGYIT